MPVYIVHNGPTYETPEDFEKDYKEAKKSYHDFIRYFNEKGNTSLSTSLRQEYKKKRKEFKNYLFYYLTQNKPLSSEKVCNIITRNKSEIGPLFNYWEKFNVSTETCKAIIETLKDQQLRRSLFHPEYQKKLFKTLKNNVKDELKNDFLKGIFEKSPSYYDSYNIRIHNNWGIIKELDLTKDEQELIINHLNPEDLFYLQNMKNKYQNQEGRITEKIVYYINHYPSNSKENIPQDLRTFLEKEKTHNLNQDIFSALVNNASYREKWLYLLVHYQKKFKKEIFDLGKVKQVYIDRAIKEDLDSLAQVRTQMEKDKQWKRNRKDIDYLIKTYNEKYKDNSNRYNDSELPYIFFSLLSNENLNSFFSKEDQEYFCNQLLEQKHPDCYKLYLCRTHEEVHPRMRKHFEDLCNIIPDDKIAEFIGACDRNNLFSTKLLSENFVQRLNNLNLLERFFKILVKRTPRNKCGELLNYKSIKNNASTQIQSFRRRFINIHKRLKQSGF